MGHEILPLADDPALALEALREASRSRPVLVFKHSPICPVSHRAQAQLESWLGGLEDEAELALARIDVIAGRSLARGLTAELGIRHESPQALWFRDGDLAWHASHDALTRERFEELLAQSRS